jgi:hypothetical protein
MSCPSGNLQYNEGMNSPGTFFKSLSVRERALSMNHALGQLLGASLRDVSFPLTPLQTHYLQTEVGYVYQHFGFSVFGPQAIRFLATQLSLCSGVAENALRTWLESVGYTLLEDFNILKIVTGEPDWDAVDRAFFRDFSKRILCAEMGESADLGLDSWNGPLVRELCMRASRWVARAQGESLDTILPDVVELLQDVPCGIVLATAIGESLEEVSDNFLQLLVWRVQFLTSFSDVRQEAKFIVRAEGEEPEQLAARFAALLALFVPQEAVDGTMLLPTSPVSVSALAAILRSDFTSPYFDCDLFRNWLDLSDATLRSDLERMMQQGKEAGLLFEVPKGRNGRAYGLTLAALRIVSPFREAISNALVRTPFEGPNEVHVRLSV